jgi:predicted ATPase
VTGVQFETTTRDEVMLSLTEHDGSRTSAREMSDGLLRFAAVATALQSTAQDLDVDADDDAVPLTPDSEPVTGKVRVVLEEIENGLHPSQARVALRMIEDAVTSSGLQVTVTTHSPALLNALTGELNDKVVVCYRDEEGHSRLSPLVELSGYAQAMAHGEIGDLVTRSELVAPTPERSVDLDAFLSAIGG